MGELTSLGSTDVLTTTLPLHWRISSEELQTRRAGIELTISTSSFFAEELVACEGVCRVSVR